jgi:hypothetical protein
MSRNSGLRGSSMALARAILSDRRARRQWMTAVAIAPCAMTAAGTWWIDGWLGAQPLRFLLWWGTCGLLALMLLLFAAYDALAVLREERGQR